MGDEDGIDQVKEEEDGVVALGGGRTCIYTGDVDWRRSSQEGRRRHQAWRRSDTCRHRGFGGFGLKTIGRAGGFGLKNIGGRFAGLGLKTRRGRFDELSLKTTWWMIS